MNKDMVKLLADLITNDKFFSDESLLNALKFLEERNENKPTKKTDEQDEKMKRRIREEQKAKIDNLLNQYISYCKLKAPEVPSLADMKGRYFGKYSSIKDFGVAMFNMIYGNKVPPELWKFFDFEKYGETFTKDYVIGEGGYVFYVGDGPLNA